MCLFCVLLASIKRHSSAMDVCLAMRACIRPRPDRDCVGMELGVRTARQNQNVSLARKLACTALKKMRQFVKQGKRM